ncbi:Scr1 family TA system antitoxin-like transcriptional regulator [Streptomyces sp. NPDC127092]|uniref:Scr1 family TA system antitoxin-like transcriptional regulator n=1 Tax=Streptomyces sp. NPDC127092 TaxID=3347135 RepID=UPI003656095A
MARQERLTASDPLHVWAVIAEGVLWQEVGGRDVMRAQLDHLVRAAELPDVGPYLILGFSEASALDVVLADNSTGSIWLEQDTDVSR